MSHVGKYAPFQEVSGKPTGDVHERVDNVRDAEGAGVLAAATSEDVAETSRNQTQGAGGELILSPQNLVV